MDRGYGSEWRKIRNAFLAMHRDCERCGDKAECVDHRIPKARGGTDTRDNLQALCNSCHSAKTNREDGGFGNVRRDD